MFRSLVIVLQAMLAVAFLVGLFAQVVVIPTAAADEVAFFPPYESVRVPFVTFAIVFVACGQVLLVALWGVLHRAGKGTVFEPGALAWTNIAIGAVAAAAVVLASVCGYVFFTDIPTPYDGMELLGLWMGSGAATLVAAVLACMLLVVRYWHRHAIAQRAELEQVV
ncbi:DUF2975 domain-containing protein [Lentzea flava]|uniref:DUF2975 domain-containing protein n=1 Tax=Lentzea flava TaxID=103732 RepID=A0ABQ2UKE9_9PSEU|nr:DUF2975 domain-containing protein [Lentzea flava]MCP2200483.1 Protein of unknown function (DUF2975) [Lentzea flava]GGU42286.1 hypothetical protein GCM10010178_38510 [Lentzea flava]